MGGLWLEDIPKIVKEFLTSYASIKGILIQIIIRPEPDPDSLHHWQLSYQCLEWDDRLLDWAPQGPPKQEAEILYAPAKVLYEFGNPKDLKLAKQVWTIARKLEGKPLKLELGERYP